jgi:hypothetical protein
MLIRTDYEWLVYTLLSYYPTIRLSTLILAPPGLDIARLTGLVAFGSDLVLCVYELLNFRQGVIETYRYEVTRCHPPFTESPLPPRTASATGLPTRPRPTVSPRVPLVAFGLPRRRVTAIRPADRA